MEIGAGPNISHSWQGAQFSARRDRFAGAQRAARPALQFLARRLLMMLPAVALHSELSQ
jgi:hypothetical protein